MSEEPVKEPFGRPKIELNWNEFNKLCYFQCTLWEIAAWFDCSEDTIERRVKEEHGVTFAEYFKHFSGKGKVSLRRKGFEMAMEGNSQVWKFFAQNFLDMNDKQDVTVQTSIRTPETDAVINDALGLLKKATN